MVERKRSRKKQEFVSDDVDDVGDQQWGKKNDNKTSAHQAEILRRLVPKRLERSKTMEVEKRYQIVRVKYRSRISYEGQTEFWIRKNLNFGRIRISVTHLYGCKQL